MRVPEARWDHEAGGTGLTHLLDTIVVSIFRRVEKAPQQILDWAASVDAEDFYLSVIPILEIEQGILMKERKDKVQADLYRDWLNSDILVRFEASKIAARPFKAPALHSRPIRRSARQPPNRRLHAKRPLSPYPHERPASTVCP